MTAINYHFISAHHHRGERFLLAAPDCPAGNGGCKQSSQSTKVQKQKEQKFMK